MKRLITLTSSLLASLSAFCQIGVDYHQSSVPLIGVTYEFERSFLAELRLTTDIQLDDFAPEIMAAYKIVNKEDHNLYAGIGGRFMLLEGFLIPVGLAFYPFDKKAFGFHTEATFIIGDTNYFRGSLGIRYRFLKE